MAKAMRIKLLAGETVESELVKWTSWARAQETHVLTEAEGSWARKEAQKSLDYTCRVIGALESMAR